MAKTKLWHTFAKRKLTEIKKEMNALVIFLIFFAISLVGWCIAEIKANNDVYSENDAEKSAMSQFLDNQKKGGYEEMSIRDVIKNISTKGFSSI